MISSYSPLAAVFHYPGWNDDLSIGVKISHRERVYQRDHPARDRRYHGEVRGDA